MEVRETALHRVPWGSEGRPVMGRLSHVFLTLSVSLLSETGPLGVLEFLGSAAGEPSVDSGPGEVPSSD